MPKFSKKSKKILSSAHPYLQHIFKTVIKSFDCTIVCSHRGEKEQNKLCDAGKSKVRYPHSKHNKNPSMAVDAYPFIDGKVSFDYAQCYFFAGYVLGVAKTMGFRLRLGGDWDCDMDVNDESFKDLGHYEIIL